MSLDSILAINGLQVVIKNFPFLLEECGLTLKITVLSVFFGMVLGLIAGLLKLSKSRILSFIATIYIDFFRGTPLFCADFAIVFWYFAADY
ncbi:MAG: ABC transporter permease subunit [Candidatus Syntrophopropionicum ammoniitolerans]